MNRILSKIVRGIKKSFVLKKIFKLVLRKFPFVFAKLAGKYRSISVNEEIVIRDDFSMEKVGIDPTECLDKKRNVYVDVSLLAVSKHISGTQRVCREILSNLVEILGHRDEYEVIAICSDDEDFQYYQSLNYEETMLKIGRKKKENKIIFHKGDMLLLLDANVEGIAKRRFMYDLMVSNEIFVFALLYDIIPLQYPGFFSKEYVEIFAEYIRTLPYLSGVIADSHTTLNYYRDWLRDNQIKIRDDYLLASFRLGADFIGSNKQSERKHNAFLNELKKRRTFLVVSTIEPRKCHSQILKAFEILWSENYDINLVFVGKYGWQMEQFEAYMKKHPEKGKRFWWINNADDNLLSLIYTASDAVIMASLEEGFGLSVVEAASYKKKVIVRDIEVFREVAGDGAFYFSGLSGEALAESIGKWITLDEDGNTPGSNNIKTITWKESTLELLRKLRISIDG